eukprot:scaffold170744_cov56-Attheya_sp.AAC.7
MEARDIAMNLNSVAKRGVRNNQIIFMKQQQQSFKVLIRSIPRIWSLWRTPFLKWVTVHPELFNNVAMRAIPIIETFVCFSEST